MRGSVFVYAAAGLPFLWSLCVRGQERRAAITVDDLPVVQGSVPVSKDSDPRAAERINRNLLAAFEQHHVPVTGFVIQNRVESLGPAGIRILKEWVTRGFDLGNHTYSHADINGLSVEQIEEEIVRGEPTIRALMEQTGRKLTFFRFPMNHTGDTRPKHDEIAAFLAKRGYRVATCTIDTSDYVFNEAYVWMLANADAASAKRLRDEYLAYTGAEIDYYARLNRQVLGYEPAEVMLLHDNRLNADLIEKVLRLFEEKRYRFVSLDAAQSDAAYQIPETYITKFGPMWGYRWANEWRVKVDGSLEADPPKWIVDYSKRPAK